MISAAADEAFAERLLTRDDVVFPEPPPLGEASLANARRVLDNRFLLIGEEYLLPEGFSWTVNPSRDKEWQIAHHKHYFAPDLVYAHAVTGDPAYLERLERLLGSWLDEMGSGFVAQSDAQVEAKRVESWVTALALLRQTPRGDLPSGTLLRRLVERIGEEASYIAAHLKPVRNHRTFQLYAVFLAGALFPELPSSREHRELARTLLTDNLLIDFLPDGVHVELSTHYHQLVAETAVGFVELSQANGITLSEVLLARLHRALAFCAWSRWPNGDIPLLNDSDSGDQRDLLMRGARLFADPSLEWAATLGTSGEPPRGIARRFDRSGYVVLTDTWGRDPETYAARQHVVYDCALLGEGSHSHYDLFSFTYHVAGGPLVVDPGRFTYSSDPDADGVDWRHRFKSTAAHNTVAIDGKDQTRYLSRTKHGPDVRVEDPSWELGGDTPWIRARARSSEYAPVHERVLAFARRSYLLLVDRIEIEDGEPHALDLRFHLDDGLDASLEVCDGQVVARTVRGEIRCLAPAGSCAELERGWVSRAYGIKHEAPVVRVGITSAATAAFVSTVSPPGVVIERIQLEHAAALVVRVRGVAEGVRFLDQLVVGSGQGSVTVARA